MASANTDEFSVLLQTDCGSTRIRIALLLARRQ
jgi:hypothetical protein